jgi:phage tail-like protein
MEITVQEYRAGNKRGNAPDKITGVHKVPDVTLTRGVMGDDTLYTWLDAVRAGKQAPDSTRTVTVELLSEEGEPVKLWKLTGARPIKYEGETLNGKATDVAVNKLVLACEDITEEML